MKSTPQQRRAIEARGNVLVSASAGAGKTTVMIKRLADVLCGGANGEFVDLDNVLCVTFTKKAAANMKEKLRKELVARIKCDDEGLRNHLRTQLGKINTADISTIDSFCSRLVKTYFYELQVDASFELVADDAEREDLKGRAMDAVFEEGYASGEEGFLTLVERLRKKRSDKSLRKMISSAYDKVRICPDYVQTLRTASQETFTEDGFKTVCARMKGAINGKLKSFVAAIDDFTAYFAERKSDPRFFKILDDMRSAVEEYMQSPDLFSAPQKLTSLRRPSGSDEDDIKFEGFCKNVKKRFKELTAYDEDTERERFFESGKTAVAFTRLLLAFDEAYDGVKRSESKLDFGDLEQYALKLLRGDGCDCDVKDGIKSKYRYVFVDEYQDVNPIQDEIISLAAGNDVFLVGDVKQAIYGFRGSRSEFFNNKCSVATENGEFIILPDNFRSASAVIDFVNAVFSKTMNPQCCSFDYSFGHAMCGGSRYGAKFYGKAEFCLFEKGGKEKEEAKEVYSVAEEKSVKRRASNGALAVLKLVEEALDSTYYDADEGVEKKVQTGDICILTRKRSNADVQEIIRTLSAEYSVASSAEVNICTRPEIIKLLDILSYLNNAEQDVPLASAMLSGLGGFTENDLAQIRLAYGKDEKFFRSAARRYSQEKSDDLAKRLCSFFGTVKSLRALSDSIGAAKLIDEIMKSGNFAVDFSSPSKTAYLRTLQRNAYGANGELSLNAFLSKIKASGGRICAPASVATDCINVMTMHASKGLEFPVVIVADIAASFKGDSGESMPFDEEFGFAPKYYREDRSCGDTLLRKFTALKAARENISNEINLLYVAFTRAKYALYVLTSSEKEYDALSAAYADSYDSLIDFSDFALRKLDLSEVEQERGGISPVPRLDCPDQTLLAKIKTAAEFKYGYERAVTLPVKSSATGLLAERDGVENAEKLFADEFEETSGETSAEAGIAYHRFLELCDFSARDEKSVERQLKEFASSGLISDSQVRLLSVNKLTEILAVSAFGGLSGRTLFREREFLCRLSFAEYEALRRGERMDGITAANDGNGVIVQGAIDLLSVNTQNGKVVSAEIIDYKYTSRTDDSVVKKYSPQLALYKSVVCKIYGLERKLVKTTIINIRACRQIDLDV